MELNLFNRNGDAISNSSWSHRHKIILSFVWNGRRTANNMGNAYKQTET